MSLTINKAVIYPEERNQQFLINSSGLEDTNPTQTTAEIKGYRQALQKMISSGYQREDLTLDMINAWNQLVTKTIPSISLDVQKKGVKLLADLNEQIKQIENVPQDVEAVSMLGEYFYKFHQLGLFPDTERRIDLLFLNYMMCRLRRPLIVISQNEKDKLIKAEQNPSLMKAFIADKVREVVLSPYGELMTRQSAPQPGQASETYINDENEKRIVEWHALFAAKNKWQEESEKKE